MKSQLHAFIEQLLSPPNGIENGEKQRQARLLSMLILVFTPIAVLIVFYHLEKTNFNPINSLVGFTAILGFVIAFFVSRTRYFQVAGFVVILTITGSVVASVTIDAISPVPLIYISFSPLVAILVLSTRDAIGFSIFNIFLAVGISPLVSRTATYEEDLVFLLIITFVVWIIVLLRRYDLKEIEEKNRDVLDLKQKQIETELENQRARLLSNFIQDVSHDIKTPLTIINTSTFILRRLLPVQDHDRIVRIQNQVKLLTKIVDDLIHMSQLDVTYQLKLAPINVNLLLGEISTASETKAQSQLQSIQHNFDPQLPQILGDRDELYRCFTQLIQNALIYTSDGGRITIETKDYANSVLIAIEDTGIGISGADLPFIFQRLYRVNKARTHTEESGAGLGLAMVKRVIDLHRGTIAVSSNIGIGTRFDIQLPKDPRVSNHDKLEFSHSYRLPTI